MKGQHTVHNNQNVNMYIIVTLIVNLSFNRDTVFNTLFIEMPYFCIQLFCFYVIEIKFFACLVFPIHVNMGNMHN